MVPDERVPRDLKAVALRYRPGVDRAPRVVAAGRGYLAERIVTLARRHGVPLVENPAADQLVRLGAGGEIPPELYRVVAEVLAFVYFLDNRAAERSGCGGGRP